MTSITTTAHGSVAQHHRTSSTGERIRRPFIGIALAAAVIGSVAGATGTLAATNILRDPAAERAEWLAYAEQVREAAYRQYLWELSHPQPGVRR